MTIQLGLIIAGSALAVIAAAAWCSKVRNTANELDAELEVLLGEEPPADPEESAPVALTVADVRAMTADQITAILAPLDWPVHPALQRKPRPSRRDPYDFFADGGM